MPELVSQALDLVLYGMGSVFIFLTVLVGVTMLMSYLIGTDIGTDPTANEPGIPSGSMDPKLLAAISAAVKRHREDRQ